MYKKPFSLFLKNNGLEIMCNYLNNSGRKGYSVKAYERKLIAFFKCMHHADFVGYMVYVFIL